MAHGPWGSVQDPGGNREGRLEKTASDPNVLLILSLSNKNLNLSVNFRPTK